MSSRATKAFLKTDGKFFRFGSERVWLKAVTFGPFPIEKAPDMALDFARIKEAHFHSIRLFELPDRPLLDEAFSAGLFVFAGLDWQHYEDFISHPKLLSSAKLKLVSWLRKHGRHPALAGIYVGNEIPTDLVRWMGPVRVRTALEDLIQTGRQEAPDLLFAYANYPSTEYLEPANADFTAFNIYLEDREAFSEYLARLQNIAGDRPLVISEFGIDSMRNGAEQQARTLGWALETARNEETAGINIYAWSDLWLNNGEIIDNWSFGITDREGAPKPALDICKSFSCRPPLQPKRKFSIIVCTRNGAGRISSCLDAIRSLSGGPYETIVVDDGSTDATASVVSEKHPDVILSSIPSSGLSAARNVGAEMATGEILAFTDDDCEPDREWIVRLDKSYGNPSVAAAGGPNLAPLARNWQEAVIHACPGSPSHVLIDDRRAEHLPGCNLSVRRDALRQIGGFDPVFRTAGDDVDFCWRLGDQGLQMAFVPGAFVWHWSRPSILTFLNQQVGYGKAEKILIAKHPDRFSKSGKALWDGFVYGGGPISVETGSIIYHGPLGQAGYQSITNQMLPLRPLEFRFRNGLTELAVEILSTVQPAVRSWFRNRRLHLSLSPQKHASSTPDPVEFSVDIGVERDAVLRHFISENWEIDGENDAWDLQKQGTRFLLATEILDRHHVNALFRVWGDPDLVRSTLESFPQSA